jgi:hypothetical protein
MPVTVLGLTLARKVKRLLVFDVVVEAQRVKAGALKDWEVSIPVKSRTDKRQGTAHGPGGGQLVGKPATVESRPPVKSLDQAARPNPVHAPCRKIAPTTAMILR